MPSRRSRRIDEHEPRRRLGNAPGLLPFHSRKELIQRGFYALIRGALER